MAEEKPAMLPLALKGVNTIFHNPESIFLTVKVKDILFDGIHIDCNITDFIGQMVCSQLKDQVKMFKKTDDDGLLFSFFGYVSINIIS